MASTVAQMTPVELKALIEDAIEKKLIELLQDPDYGLDLQDSVRERLHRQQEAVAAGERGQSFDHVAERLGLG